MRPLPLFLVALCGTGCIDNRAEVLHPQSPDLGYAWIGSQENPGLTAPATTLRQGHKPQEILADAWRMTHRRPTYAEWLAMDRVQRHTWPTILPILAWAARGPWPAPVPSVGAGRRWIRLGDVGSPATVPEFQELQRASVQAQSPIPWWQWFPADIPASLLPIDFTSSGQETVRYASVAPVPPDVLRQQAAAAGYLPLASLP
jgi:hypothetical protein